MADQYSSTVAVEFHTPQDGRVRLEARPGPDAPAVPGSPLRLRSLRLIEPWYGVDGGQVTELLQKRVVRTGGWAQWPHYDALDREIGIGLRLLRGCAAVSRPYPQHFSRLVGYDVDEPEPFALFLPYRGEPVSRVVRRFLLPGQRAFESGLFHCLQQLEALGVLHRSIGPETVLWDQRASRVQLVDFGDAAVRGSVVTPVPGSPWRCARDLRSDDPRFDVWSAAALVCYAVTGRPVEGGDPAKDPALRGSSLLTLLPRLLDPNIASRPTAREVLRGLGHFEIWPDVEDGAGDTEFELGGAEFDSYFPPSARSGSVRSESIPAEQRGSR